MSKKTDQPRTEARKAVILSRVSSKEQEDGYSIEAQTHRGQAYCLRRDLEVVKVFEITESSTRGDRTQFMAMIKFCKAQKQTIAIVVDNVDRLQRSFREYPMLDALVQDGKIELHFITQGYVIHRDSASHERLMWSMNVIMAQSYVDSLRDNVKRSFDQKIRQGEYVSRAPLGYLNVRSNERAEIVLDPDRAHTVRRVFTEYATGLYTLGHLTKKAKEWGLRTRDAARPVSRANIHRMLGNPFYYGIMDVRGKRRPHRYAPLIDKSLFDQCQRVLKGWHKKPFRYGEYEFMFRGILTCQANGKTVSTYTKSKTFQNGNTGSWTYLRTWDRNGKVLLLREEAVLAQAAEAIQAVVLPPEVASILVSHLRNSQRHESEYQHRRADELKREDSRIRLRLDRLVDMRVDGEITSEEYSQQRARLREKQAEIARDLEAADQADDSFKNAMLLFLDFCKNAHDLFMGATTEQKRALLNFVFSNLSLDEETLCFSYKKPFDDYIEASKMNEWRQFIDRVRTTPDLRSAVIELYQIYGPILQPLLDGGGAEA